MEAVKKALVTGANGQDASYLLELLVEKGYEVHGTVRRNSVPQSQTMRIQQLMDSGALPEHHLHYMDLTDPVSVEHVVTQIMPDEIYHLGAQSHVQISFALPKYTLDVNAGGTLAILEAVRRFCPKAKVYHAATSEMFGNCVDPDGFQRETTPMIPVSPYGASKLYAHNLCHNYRNAYGIFVCSGILFNHESVRRGTNFVTNKVALGAASISLGLSDKLVLGNLDSYRDWGHARDYVEAMWLMLQREEPKDFVIATGKSHSIRDLLDVSFGELGLDWHNYVESSERYTRPEELWALRGDATSAKTCLGWQATVEFEDMIKEMVHFWVDALSNGKEYKY